MFKRAAEVLNVEVDETNKQPKWKKLLQDQVIYLQELVNNNVTNSNALLSASRATTTSSGHMLQQQQGEQISKAYAIMSK
ncbi:hypothetical protein A0J61_04739 [Choanephora cucurbitarum]|uniref:Uncharacterized protein n=1 Tax=Choanephora cucurbitarum TaxID=101091 RepID=A0A1C7NDQ5_9FUNG|nr:hypothetical protein A0J61_04739 [Choanephora cucurbitarum]